MITRKCDTDDLSGVIQADTFAMSQNKKLAVQVDNRDNETEYYFSPSARPDRYALRTSFLELPSHNGGPKKHLNVTDYLPRCGHRRYGAVESQHITLD